jgi:type IV pilus assembly protein PilM
MGLHDQNLVSSVSGKGSLIRYLDMPRMPLEDLRKSFVYDLDKYLPFDPQSIHTDCAVLDPEGKDKKMLVLLAAVKKEMVDDRLKLFKEAGLELSRLSLNSIAMANAFKTMGPAAVTSVNAKAVLDIGYSISSLMILKDASPRFARDIFVGSQDLTKQIANTLGIDLVEAEKIKCDPADKIEQVIDACDTPINNLITEIRLSMDYFMTEKNVQVDELFLIGGGSLLKGIDGVFEKNLGVRVKNWDPLANARLNASEGADQMRSYAAQFGVALGLGL